MALNPGTRLGAYEVVSLLGEGGMGQVYRAKDTRLKRDVALKILPDAFASDPDRVARFQREAELLATLNHPNIAGIHGLEQTDGTRALVLELVEGPTLADRIAQGPIPVDEALLIAGQIADALEAAHERGVIHRDLKPANIKLTADDKVKVLDFGLAKMLENPVAPSTLSMSPTLSVHATYAGVILGTAAYMSPEQARGKTVDKRTDIWAFGCVLYEMLTGTPPFSGEDVADMLGAVIHKDVAWDRLPSGTPATVRTVLARCHEKDPRRRFRDIGDVQLALTGAFESSQLSKKTNDAPTPRRGPSRRYAGVGIAAVIVLAAVGATWWTMRPGPFQAVRFTIGPLPTQPLLLNTFDRAISISPDGRYIAYVEGMMGDRRLMIRSIDRLDAMPLRSIEGTVNAVTPFFDPESRWVGFFESGDMKKVSVTGGPPITICKATNPRGASWGPGNTIIFATNNRSLGLRSVSAAGGEPKTLATPDTAHGEVGYAFPSVLPGGRAVLFTIASVRADQTQVAVLDLKTGTKKILVQNGSQAEYVESRHLVYAAAGTLRLVRFDPSRLEVQGDPVPLVEQVVMAQSGAANFALSHTGTLVYVPGDGNAVVAGAQRVLVWVNRQGREEDVGAPPRTYTYPRLSPDGVRVALDIRDQENDIWIWDLNRRTLTRLTFDPGLDRSPVWTPDSKRVLFSSQQGGGGGNVFWKAADGTGTVERVTNTPNTQYPMSISPDGYRLIVRDDSAKFGEDLAVVTLNGKPSTEPLLQTQYNERNAEISPDGRWMAYESNESGQNQVYVRPFPKVEAGRWQISPFGGTRPLWAKNGRELFYLDFSGLLMAVPVQATPAFAAGNPSKVFDTKYVAPTGNTQRTYDVSADGQRFLMIKEPQAGSSSSAVGSTSNIVVVLNWLEELTQRLPPK